jgi:hypothetical protein
VEDEILNGTYADFLMILNPKARRIKFSALIDNIDIRDIFSVRNGNVWLGAMCGAIEFPTPDNAFNRTSNGGQDVLLLKIDTTKGTLEYASFYGGSGGDSIRGIAVDSEDNVFGAGYTGSYDLPTVNELYNYTRQNDVFVFKLQVSVLTTTSVPSSTNSTSNSSIPPTTSTRPPMNVDLALIIFTSMGIGIVIFAVLMKYRKPT